ncbi:hypothetical protein QBC46DRAFT_407683 [Diplogelasinospora grovesii]|uniref:Uncharacterized protein n=1 Tax=Diplogelasinospora grovesii TaxID=303347 RepID=A0AAN6S5V1_9PEZI|nr:hypothetical protein QBC46DRAFT_407683 [Diplogelasinospora grovesii]
MHSANRDSLRFLCATVLCKLNDAANRSNNSPKHTHTTVRSRPDDVAKSNGSSNSPIRTGSKPDVVAKSNGSSNSPIYTGSRPDVVAKSNGSSNSPIRSHTTALSKPDNVAKSNGSSNYTTALSRPDDVANTKKPRQSTIKLQPRHAALMLGTWIQRPPVP